MPPMADSFELVSAVAWNDLSVPIANPSVVVWEL